MLRKLSLAGSLRPTGKDRGKIVKYTSYTARQLADDDLDEVAVISNAAPENVRYGSGSNTTVNGPRVVPGIITSAGGADHMNTRVVTTTISQIHKVHSTGTTSGPSKALPGPPPTPVGSKPRTNSDESQLPPRASSRESLIIETVAARVDTTANGARGGPGTGYSPSGNNVKGRSPGPGQGPGYVNKAHTNSDMELSRKVRDQRRKEIKKEFEKWETSTCASGDKSGCNWSFVFDPSGRLCYYWSMIVSVAFVYNFWVIIHRFAFEEINEQTMTVWLTLDGIADFIYILDIAVHFRTGYLEEGVLQTDGIKLRQHYMNSTMFYIDCLCLLPLDFLYLSIGFNSMFRCFRLVKIYRFWSFLDRTERHTNYPNVFRTVSLTHYILVIFHWNACLYHLISKRGGFGSKDWSPGARDENCSDVTCDYLHAFYWSTLALTTIGDLPRPRTKGEYLFLIIELVSGLFLLATVLGHVANIVTNVSAARKEFQAKLDAVKTYMRIRRVPDHLKIKVIKWFDYLWMTQKSSDEDKSVGFLPAKLKAEIAIHVHLDTLKRVEIFQNTEAGFLCALVLRLRPVLFSPGDYVCRKGEVGKEMYIVNRGKLQVVTDNGKTVLATLRAGSYFGEISILNMGTAGNRRTASVRSVGYSDLFCLSKQDMWDVLKDYPAARVRLEAIAGKRLEKYRKEPMKKISMGRSRSTPGLVESRSQLPITDAQAAQQDATSASAATLLTDDDLETQKMHSMVGTPTRSMMKGRNMETESESSNSNGKPDNVATSSSTPRTVTGVTFHPQTLGPYGAPIFGFTPPTPSMLPPQVPPMPAQYILTPQLTIPPGHPWYERRTSQPQGDFQNIGPPSPLPYFPHSPDHANSLFAFRAISPAQSAPHLALPQYNLHMPPSSPSPLSNESNATGTAGPAPPGAQPPLPTEAPQEILLSEITRLRERLISLETENTTMSIKLNQQQWDVENRLAEIELQICQGSAPPTEGGTRSRSPSLASDDSESERNKESII